MQTWLGHWIAEIPAVSPITGTARSPSSSQRLSLTFTSDSRTTSSARRDVRRRPFTNSTGIPRLSISCVICGPAPCTTTTS